MYIYIPDHEAMVSLWLLSAVRALELSAFKERFANFIALKLLILLDKFFKLNT